MQLHACELPKQMLAWLARLLSACYPLRTRE